MLKSGVTREICGNIAMSNATPTSSRLPGKARRATAYAAIPPITTAITVVISPIPIELISAELNASPEKIPL